MKSFGIGLFLIIIIAINGNAQDEYSGTQVLSNTFWIKTNQGTLSAFAIDYNGKELLISALHGFSRNIASPSRVKLQININKIWKSFDAILYHLSDTSIDIAVLVLNESIQHQKPYDLCGDVMIGQECRFYGFPYGRYFFTDAGGQYMPFIKRALVSSVQSNVDFLDGMNNPGFSGGPVIIKDVYSKQYKILGVISGYHPQSDSIVRKNKDTVEVIKYQENSGIIYCYPIQDVKSLLDNITAPKANK
jgi:hypothetical protein